jgi:hypothetical protein
MKWTSEQVTPAIRAKGRSPQTTVKHSLANFEQFLTGLESHGQLLKSSF